jgi:diaminopimelate decarboxylase
MPSDTQQLFTEFWADGDGFREVDYSTIETPCYLVSLKNLEKNLKILDFVEKTAGCKILLALKSFGSVEKERPRA